MVMARNSLLTPGKLYHGEGREDWRYIDTPRRPALMAFWRRKTSCRRPLRSPLRSEHSDRKTDTLGIRSSESFPDFTLLMPAVSAFLARLDQPLEEFDGEKEPVRQEQPGRFGRQCEPRLEPP